MYKLYTDKQENFQCSIELTGVSLSNSQARLVVETDELNLMFPGTINANGKCSVPVKKLRGLLPESAKGQISLEVIAEDTYFRPWQSDFAVETAKKVTIEVHSQQKPVVESKKATVKVTSQAVTLTERQHVINIMKVLVNENINLQNLSVKKTKVNTIIAEYIQSNPVEQEQVAPIIDKVIKVLTRKK